MVQLVYFARLREALGTGSETLELPPGVGTVAALTEWLRARGGDWQVQLAPEKPVRVAVNQEMATPETAVADGDEIAYFPPVTGG
jgi:sulfur-carrier protein